ncbi:hypothetical protein PMI18_03653 [Pseudomonas sp. GM102]|uniref:hypothetical protein n=1 Tax=Pseudomonas sp. GM102 TaxID=1144321 RepID=UPI00026F6F54|nr:hypothetical protein [Pseudomonas sp. GM102]EJL99262.1 hypothetical protein PMI18_03653 [Pseudomonas sp. GM102]
MSTDLFVGKMNVKFSFEDGEPAGPDFDTDKIQIAPNAVQASESKKFVQMTYKENLPVGPHDFKVGPEEPSRLEYNNGERLIQVTGTAHVTVSNSQRQQDGNFDGTFELDGFTRQMKGTFDCKYFVE